MVCLFVRGSCSQCDAGLYFFCAAWMQMITERCLLTNALLLCVNMNWCWPCQSGTICPCNNGTKRDSCTHAASLQLILLHTVLSVPLTVLHMHLTVHKNAENLLRVRPLTSRPLYFTLAGIQDNNDKVEYINEDLCHGFSALTRVNIPILQHNLAGAEYYSQHWCTHHWGVKRTSVYATKRGLKKYHWIRSNSSP